jgi:hypothetical protein
MPPVGFEPTISAGERPEANNASKKQMGFNSAFKWLKLLKTWNGCLNNLNDPVLNVLKAVITVANSN